MNLYIIGNGFDTAHGLNTSYFDFREYIEENDWEFLTAFEAAYNFCSETPQETAYELLWKEFEKNLSNINETEIIENGTYIDLGLEGGDIDISDTLNEYWEEQYGYIIKLNEFLKQWIKSIDITTSKKTSFINNDNNDLYMTFNYTLVLEDIYKIDSYDILHIHGSIDEYNYEPIIGHGNAEKIEKCRELSKKYSEEFLEKESCIYGALSNYYERTLKDVNHFLFVNEHFFDKLKQIENIYVIGHSFGDVDMPYFKRIHHINPHAIWNVFYYKDEEQELYKQKLLSLGVKQENMDIKHSSKFFDLK